MRTLAHWENLKKRIERVHWVRAKARREVHGHVNLKKRIESITVAAMPMAVTPRNLKKRIESSP